MYAIRSYYVQTPQYDAPPAYPDFGAPADAPPADSSEAPAEPDPNAALMDALREGASEQAK